MPHSRHPLAFRAPVWLAALAIACVSSAPPPAAPTPAAKTASPPRAAANEVAPTAPAFRLPAGVRPVQVVLDLTVVPGQDTFHGEVTVALALDAPASVIWMHGTDLQMGAAEIDGAPARAVVAAPDFVGFVPRTRVGPGTATLHASFAGTIDRVRSRGLYQVAEGKDEWYAYTFFEAVDARRAFPCFDEPGFKVPWKLTLHVKNDQVALANTAIESERPEDGGMKAVSFAWTKPLPSYLVAFIVGPFDVLDGGVAGHHATPFHIALPRGRGAEAKYALEVTPRIIALLEDYFGMPYPYGKLDVAVVPRFWGTMEHPGIVALGQPLTLIKPDADGLERRQGYANIAIHELSHYWFGDYVTMAWWDDTWLNEALAQWLDAKITDQLEPRWGFRRDRRATTSYVMNADSLSASRPMRLPIEDRYSIRDAFDAATTYSKGSLVFAMYETYFGEDRFQQAIRAYLADHAWKNATAEDFLRSMGAVLGEEFAASFRTFLEQPGVPEVAVTLECDAAAPPRLALAQKRFLPLGSTASTDQTWRVPMCVTWGGKASGSGEACGFLAAKTGGLELAGAKACPSWIMANQGARGYYRTVYRGDLLSRLIGQGWARLDPAERVRVVSDLSAQVRAGTVPAADALALLPRLAGEPSPEVLSGSFEILSVIRRSQLGAELRPNLARFIRKLWGARARAAGWLARTKETPDDHERRLMLLQIVGRGGEDVEIRAQAAKLAERWLADHRSVEPATARTALGLYVERGDQKLWERVRTAVLEAQDRSERELLLGVLADFRDPELAKEGLALIGTGAIDVRDARAYVLRLFRNDETREVAYRALLAGYDEVTRNMRDDEIAGFLRLPGLFCDAEHVDEARAFFGPRAKKVDGGEHALAVALESATLCAAAQARQAPSIEAFLKRY
jgi:aminopeptidase N